MKPEQFVQHLKKQRASAILRTEIVEAAGPAMEAAVRAGFRILEFTLTTPGAFDRIAEFSRYDNVIVGAGTVLTPAQARQAFDAGARFLVSPVVDARVISVALELGAVPIPGAQTPTELLRAHRSGAPLQKLFPAPAGGPAFVRACLGPMPFLRIVPTNGVDDQNVQDWFDAGAFAAGFVADLFDKQELAERRWDATEERARKLLAAVRAS